MLRVNTARTEISRYAALFRMPLAEHLAYTGSLASAAIAMVVFMSIFGMLWRTVFAAQAAESIAGLTLQQTLWYMLVTELVVLSKPLLAKEMAESVQNGSIAYELLRPCRFGLYHLSRFAGHVALRACVVLPAGALTVFLMVGDAPGPQGIAPALIALILAWGLEFCFEALIGLTAFWTEDVGAFRFVYQKVSFLLGGLLMPLEFYPPWLAGLARLTPFASILYAPARICIGPEPDLIVSTLVLQAGWLAVLTLAFQLLSRRALRNLAVNGG